MKTNCPDCDTKLIHNKGSYVMYCPNCKRNVRLLELDESRRDVANG